MQNIARINIFIVLIACKIPIVAVIIRKGLLN